MWIYYSAIDEKSKKYRSYIFVANDILLSALLDELGHHLIRFRFQPHMNFLSFAKPSLEEQRDYFFKLRLLLAAKISILTVFKILCSEGTSRHLKALSLNIIAGLKEGVSLYQSFVRYLPFFDSLILGLIRGAEQTGDLEREFLLIEEYLNEKIRMRDIVYQSIRYPFILFILIICVVVVLMNKVVPELIQISSTLQKDISSKASVLTKIYEFIVGNVFLVGSLLLLCGIIFPMLGRFSPKIRKALAQHSLKIPLVGTFYKNISSASYFLALEIFIQGHLTLNASMREAVHVIRNTYVKNCALQIVEKIEGGTSFYEALKASDLFPLYVLKIIQLGEETGQILQSLFQINQYYRNIFDRQLLSLKIYLEPLFLLILGAFILWIVWSFILPLYDNLLMVEQTL